MGSSRIKNAEIGHERPGDQDALLLALGENTEGTPGQMRAPKSLEQSLGTSEIRRFGPLEEQPDAGKSAADRHVERAFAHVESPRQAWAHPADRATEGPQVYPPVLVAQHANGSPGGIEVPGDDLKQRGLAGAVGAEQSPMLPGKDVPRDLLDERRAVSDHVDAVQGNDGLGVAKHSDAFETAEFMKRG